MGGSSLTFSSLNFCPQPHHPPYYFGLAMPTVFQFLENAGLSRTPRPLYRLFLPSRALCPALSHPTSYPPSDFNLNPPFLPSSPTFPCVLTVHKCTCHALFTLHCDGWFVAVNALKRGSLLCSNLYLQDLAPSKYSTQHVYLKDEEVRGCMKGGWMDGRKEGRMDG